MCGMIWVATAAATMPAASPAAVATACTWAKPFKWGVRFDGQENQCKHIVIMY